MVTKRDTRSRRKPAKKVANSKIAEAQKAASEVRTKANGPNPAGVGTAAGPEKKKKPTAPQPDPNQKTYKGDPNYSRTPDRTKTSGPGDSGEIRDPLLAGLTLGIDNVKDPAVVKALAESRAKNPIANPSLFGVSTKKRAQNLSDRLIAMNASIQQAKSKGNAVYMGQDPKAKTAKIRRSGPERMDESGKDYEEEKVGDLVLTKDELMSWLTDEAKVAEIKAAANKAGIAVETYDDVAKLWNSVVAQAASSYSITNKKVTPWSIIQLRGKYVGADGKMKDRVTTSTNIDEMDPATARLMFEKTAMNQLGRAPTKQEVDDFIAKAQTIALKNPAVTTTRQKLGFDGNVESQTSRTVGGGQAVADQSEIAAMDQARQSEDYASYQAAGNYFPMLFEALSAPV